jgi:hypothetical protein
VSWTEPKTKHGARVVHLDQGTVAALHAHRAGQVHRVLRSGNDLLFADVEGQPLNPDGVSQRFERLVARYGCRPCDCTICGTVRRRSGYRPGSA